jgi:tRNA(fMet)-specific endonuclease VapC
MYLLDTNACIRVLNGSSERLVSQVGRHAPTEIRISSVTRAELVYGARRSARVSENLAVLAEFFAPLVSVPFDDTCADQYGALRAVLAATGRPIGPNDLLIAATALAYDLTLVTHNVREFSRVAGLKIEDWERDVPSG